MKFLLLRRVTLAALSLPVRGAWVEICPRSTASTASSSSLPVRGAWVEISIACPLFSVISRRSPCGERGLKCPYVAEGAVLPESLPVRGAWVEMTQSALVQKKHQMRRSPCGERGLKFCVIGTDSAHAPVAPRAGSVG